MKKLIVISVVFMMLFAFVACNSEAGGQSGGGGGGNGSELTPAEQAIKSKYGDDVFYFAELADMAASYSEGVASICGATDDTERAYYVSMYANYGITVTNATGTTVSFSGTDDGVTVKADITNYSSSKGMYGSISYDADVTVSGKENLSAQVSLEIDLDNNTTTITKGKFKAVTFGTGSQALQQANQCLQEIQALDENGNSQGQGGQQGQGGAQGEGGQGQGGSQGQGGQGQGEEWTMGTASLPAHTAREIALAMEGMDFYVLIEEPQGMAGVSEGGVSYFYEYGIIHDAKSGNDVQLWAKRWDEMPAQYGQESQYDMIAMDRTPEHQIPDLYEPEKTSDYIYYESDYTDNWVGPDTALYHDDSGSRDWHDAVVFWLYDGEDIFAEEYAQDTANANYAGGIYYHYSDLVKPYTPLLLAKYNGNYEILSQKAVVADLQCTVYRYADELYYIADSADFYNICLKHTWLVQGKEYVMFEVKELHTFPAWPVK